MNITPTPDDCDTYVVTEESDNRVLGEIATFSSGCFATPWVRWQVTMPFNPQTYLTRDEAAEALREALNGSDDS